MRLTFSFTVDFERDQPQEQQQDYSNLGSIVEQAPHPVGFTLPSEDD